MLKQYFGADLLPEYNPIKFNARMVLNKMIEIISTNSRNDVSMLFISLGEILLTAFK